jgi:transcriptional regulator with XRE-family HTH domain
MRGKRGGPVDAIVGQTIRVHRLNKRISQSALGEKIGVSFQQVQKYENGSNRVGASRLLQIAQALRVPVDTLFRRVESEQLRKARIDDPLTLLSNGQALRVARAFSDIPDRRMRSAIVELVETIARTTR